MIRNFFQFNKEERGDTLIEVTFALAILAFVLLSSTLVATRAFRQGQTARERTTISGEAQAQMEALRSFRDNRSWEEFLEGPGSGAFAGVLTGGAVSPCAVVTTACFHMVVVSTGGGKKEYVPVGGNMAGAVPTSFIEIEAAPIGDPVVSVVFTISYGFATLGGGPGNVGHIKTTLTNLQLVLDSTAPLGDEPDGTATTPTGGSVPTTPNWTVTRKISLANPSSGNNIVSCRYDWGDGTSTTLLPTECIPDQGTSHTYGSPADLGPPYAYYSIDCLKYAISFTVTDSSGKTSTPSTSTAVVPRPWPSTPNFCRSVNPAP